MKFPLSALLRHLDTSLILVDILNNLTKNGLEVEECKTFEFLSPFLVVKVLEIMPHPNADRLKCCLVQVGQDKTAQTTKVVCGALNVRPEMYTVFAPVGVVMPQSAMRLKKALIRGEESHGMLCSWNELGNELGFSHDSDSIIDIGDFCKVADNNIGSSARDFFGYNDPVIQLNITPNRSDCFSIRGIARDLAICGAGVLKTLKTPQNLNSLDVSTLNAIASEDTSTNFVKINVQRSCCAQDCPSFFLRVIHGVDNTCPTPLWIRHFLEKSGVRSINRLVDVTNFMCIEFGQPMHVYDMDKVLSSRSKCLYIRYARTAETFTGLDHQEYTLDPFMMVIADEEKVLSLAGVMGDERCAVDKTTRIVGLECALFDPLLVSKQGRACNILSEARTRFERGIDYTFQSICLDRATEMILNLCGSQFPFIDANFCEPRQYLYHPHRSLFHQEGLIKMRKDKFKRYMGFYLGTKTQKSKLECAGCIVTSTTLATTTTEHKKEDSFLILPPPWRTDIWCDADCVGEIVRLLRTDLMSVTQGTNKQDDCQTLCTKDNENYKKHNSFLFLKKIIASIGYQEIVSWSFIEEDDYLDKQRTITLKNPMTTQMKVMRSSLCHGLLKILSRHQAYKRLDQPIFEEGAVFEYDDASCKMVQTTHFSGIRPKSGVMEGHGRNWREPYREVDFFDMKKDVCGILLSAFSDDLIHFEQDCDNRPPYFHPTFSASCFLKKKHIIGHFGLLHPDYIEKFHVRGPVGFFELFVSLFLKFPFFYPSLVHSNRGNKSNKELFNDRQDIIRDFSFVIDFSVSFYCIKQAIFCAVDKGSIRFINVFDVFFHHSLGDNKKAIGIEVCFIQRFCTMTEEDIQGMCQRITDKIKKDFDGVLRLFASS